MNKSDNLEELIARTIIRVKKELTKVFKQNKEKFSSMRIYAKKPTHTEMKTTKLSSKKSREHKIFSRLHDIASVIDHTLLRPDATKKELAKLCKEAKKYNFKTVCVNSSNIPFVSSRLKGSSVLPISVVGFPLGAMSTEAKVFETEDAIRKGAKEIDMVINIGKLKSKEFRAVFNDIKSVVETAKPLPVKVIIETALLDTDEKIIASTFSKAAGAAFVKTSTGFSGGGAKEEDLKLIRMVVGKEIKIKASGGVKTYEDAIRMIKAGADRIGSSSSVAIITEAKRKYL